MKRIQLSIPEPCHENWEAMSPTQQGRYCNACAKEVIDFSDMSDTQVLNYFLKKKKEENVCGRAYPDQLDRSITGLPRRKKYWQWQYILPAFLFFMKPAKTKAQGLMAPLTYDSSSCVKPDHSDKTAKQSGKKNIINGVVKDEEGRVVPYASVKVTGTSLGAIADEQGRFSLKAEQDAKTLEISSLNYETREVLTNETEIVLTKKVKVMDEVVVISYETIRRREVAGGMRVCRINRTKIITDTIRSWVNNFKPSIRIYPNPVVKGTLFTVAMKLKQAGNYTIQVFDAAGRLITEKKVNISTKEYNGQITSNSSWTAGMYYVKVIDNKGVFIKTGNLIIQ